MACKSGGGVVAAVFQAGAAVGFVQQLRYGLVLVAGADDQHVAVVFGGGAQERNAADVDFLNHVGLGRAAGHGFLKRIQINHYQINGRNAVLRGLRQVAGLVAAVQDAPKYLRVQRFDAPPKYLRKAGEVFHGRDFGPLLFQKLLGAARGVELHAEAAQNGYQRLEPVFVVHGKQGGANGLVGHIEAGREKVKMRAIAKPTQRGGRPGGPKVRPPASAPQARSALAAPAISWLFWPAPGN